MLDEITSEKAEIVDRLTENTAFLEKLVVDLNSQKEELEEIKALQSRKRDDLQEAKTQLSERQKRLREVTSGKEYGAVEREVESFKKSTEQIEEELLHLLEVVESTEASIKDKEEKIVHLREGIASDEAEAEEQLSTLDGKITALENRRDQARTEVSKRVLHKYDFIRSRRPGLAIVAAKGGHCEGCFMALPPQQFIEIQRGETLETCPSCNRILYYWEDAVGETVKAAAGEG